MNNTNTFTMDNWAQNMSWLENVLIEKKLNKQELFVSELLLEEIFLQLKKLSEDENFSAKIVVKKWFGDVNIEISASGGVYAPSNEEISEDDEEYITRAIFQAFRNKIKISRKNNRNVVTIIAHEPGNNRTRRIMFGLFGGIFIGLLIKSANFDSAEIALIDNDILPKIAP